MNSSEPHDDPFAAKTKVRVERVTADGAVVTQGPEPELENHVGVRHASALHAAGYEASRALVAAAVSEHGDTALRLAGSDVAYRSMGRGELRTVAEPDGDWAVAVSELAAGREAEFPCSVTTTDPDGKTVVELSLSWLVRRV